MSERGEINGYRCDTCGEHTYIVHVDDGVTPMFLGCRKSGSAEGGCQGQGVSLMYPPPPIPPYVLASVEWEWYEPDLGELPRLDALSGELDHVQRGGLLLRRLTNEGRLLLRGEAVSDGE